MLRELIAAGADCSVKAAWSPPTHNKQSSVATKARERLSSVISTDGESLAAERAERKFSFFEALDW